jgi:monoamine oxidase
MRRRRALLAGLSGAALAASLPRAARAQSLEPPPLPRNPAVVIVGAGVAGLAASIALQVAGIEVLVLEARPRIGGRAFTDSARFALPFDTGATWLHAAPRNPFAPLVRQLGFQTLADDQPPRIVIDGTSEDRRSQTAFARALEDFQTRLSLAGTAGRDTAMAAIAPQVDRFDRLAHGVNGPLSAGVETTSLSALDYWQQVDEAPQHLVPAGLGRAVAAYGRACPVALSTPVTRIAWGGRGVQVTTPEGRIDAEALILTVPPALIAAGRIQFDPPLPAEKQQAAAALPMGLLDKIVLPFAPAALETARPRGLFIADRGEAPADVLLWPGETVSLAIVHTGGDHARALEAAKPGEAIAWALDRLVSAYGEGLRGRVAGAGTFVRWGLDPYAEGAYSAARPGAARAREAWAAPLAPRLFFAGEACATAWAAQVAGAFESGLGAAALARAALARL